MGQNHPPDASTRDLSSFVALTRLRADERADAPAFSFLHDGEIGGGAEDRLSFAGLDRRARAIAATLQGVGVAGERALLVGPPGLEFISAFLGCLYAGVVAVPAHLPRPNRPMPRLAAIADGARPRAILTTTGLLADSDRWAAEVPALAGLHRLATDAVPDDRASSWSDPGVGRDDLAFLQYTSGSTASPRGVMVTHGNLLANSAAIRACFGSTPESRGVCWLPLFHDMGLIGGVLQTIHCGGHSTLMAPTAFLQKPVRWLRAIAAAGATISGGPDFAYDLCARKVTEEQKQGLDLSRWAVAYDGAEPVRAETLDRFAEAFAPCGFRREAFLPCYGLAESTLLVTGRRPASGPALFAASADGLAAGRIEPAPDDGPKSRTLVGSGAIEPGVAIVDPMTHQPCPADRIGEIWARGPSVAAGYWNDPEATAATFAARIAGSDDGPYLRTGDLGFARDGQLFVTGRIKDLLIIRGRNVYPQDVEATAERCHPSGRMGGAAAVAVEVDGQESLVLLLEVERLGKGNAGDDVIAAARRAIAEGHDLDVHAIRLVKAMGLPRTTSGKIQRHACRARFLDGSLEAVAAWTRPSAGSDPAPAAIQAPEAGPSRPVAEIAAWLAARVAAPLGLRPEAIDRRAPLASYGLGSIQAVALAGELEEWLGRPLSPTLAYEFPTIEDLARHLAGEQDEPNPTAEGVARTDEPIAIIGIGCRFPGASGPDAYWSLLSECREAVGEAPTSRRAAPGAERGRGGFLDVVDRFDAAFWGISPREATSMDPQQRLLLEVAWEALEDAGLAADRLAGTPVGVFVGISTDDYSRIGRSPQSRGDVYEITGNAASIAANRISYAFDFRGPSLAVDTACSSSLVAAHLACESLRRGEATVALAGGVNLVLSAEVTANFARGGFLSPDGRCKAFAADADGYVRGEGAGVVVLKPLAQAVRDGDPIYAVIRGGAINQDGRSNGLTAPSPRAQEAVLRAAWRASGVRPDQIGYVEAHGTGTPLGDPIEAKALASALSEGRDPARPCPIGSAKANIGHLEAAAGVAGLIKVALMLGRRAIPPTLHAAEPNPRIPFDAIPLKLADRDAAWVGDAPHFAGVSSFGFGGTNAHLVLASAPILAPIETPELNSSCLDLFPISARSPEALRAMAQGVRGILPSMGNRKGLARTLAVRREHHDHRLAIVGDEPAEALDAFLAGRDHPDLAVGERRPGNRPGVVFVFSGQGALWAGAGRDLLAAEPAFRAAYDACDLWMMAREGRSLAAELSGEIAPERLLDPAFAQPHQFALQVALAALWRSWGVVPDAVVGHSLGEIAAAHVAGSLDLADALRIACLRGRLMGRAVGRGRTAAVGLPAAEVRRRIGDGLAIAAENGSRQTTVSGTPGAVETLVADLRAEGIFARSLDVAVAFHGPQMDPLRRELTEALSGLRPRAGSIPFISTVTGQTRDGATLDADYWGRNLRDTVRFADAIATLADGPYEAYVEVGPHPIHAGPLGEALATRDRPTAVLGSIRRDDDARRGLLRSLAALHVRGLPLDWPAIAPPAGPLVRLPAYPWQRERFWTEARPVATPVAAPAEADLSGLLHEVAWQESDVPEVVHLNGSAHAGRWLILGDGRGLAGRLRVAIEALGGSCETEWSDEVRGTVDLRPLDAAEGDDPGSTAARICSDILALMDRVAGPDGGSRRPRAWVVTRGAQPAGHASAPVALAQSPAWGLGRSIALERPDLWGGLVDLDPDGEADEAETLAGLLVRGGGDGQVALRGGRRLIPRLVPRDGHEESAPAGPTIRPEGTYLITGGLGQLGLRTARWLAERGARRLVLVGRRGLPDRGDWDALPADHADRAKLDAILDLERLGATVAAEAVDVGSAPAVAALFDRLRRTMPAVRGVIHTAGVVRAVGEAPLDADGLRATFRSKVDGAWALHEATRNLPLDFFVMYSSVASVWGTARTGDYAAANQFLDALAAHRGSLGLPGLSINWGPWADGGMASASGWDRSFQLVGLKPLDPDAALAAFGRLAGDPSARQAAVVRADWKRLAAAFGPGGRGRFLASVEGLSRNGNGHHANGNAHANGNGAGLPAWLGLDAERRRGPAIAFFRDRVAAILGLPADKIDVDRPLNQLGFDSIMAMELNVAVEAQLGLALPLTTLLEGPSIARLAEATLGPATAPASSVTAGGPDAGTPSLAQQAMWYAHQLSGARGGYNIAGAARILSGLDPAAFRRAVDRVAARHEALRTIFPAPDGRPALRVLDPSEGGVAVEFFEASGLDPAEIARLRDVEAGRPFDLEAGPLARVCLWTRGDRDHVVLLVVHHIVADFWTTTVLLDEFGRAYRAECGGPPAGLEPLPIRFADFVRWQDELVKGPEGDRLWGYWQGKLAGPLPTLALPTDRPRPPSPTQAGALRHLEIDADLAGSLVELARSRGVSLYTALLAAFQALLGRLGGQDDIIVGSPLAGRTRPGLEGLVGYLVNMIPMRGDLAGDPSFDDLLARSRKVVHEALEHQDYPFAAMLPRLGLPFDPSRAPVYQVLLIHQKSQRLDDQGLTAFALAIPGYETELGGLPLESLAQHNGGAAFDLTLMTALVGDGRLALSLEYAADLFDPASADRLLAQFRALLAGAVADPSRLLSDLPLIDAADRQKLLVDWADGPQFIADAAPGCIHDRFEAQARRTPDAEAIVFGADRLTYRELNEQSNRLAHHLRAVGVGPGVLVGLHAGRNPSLMIGLLAILKAGGAYLPLDPSLPETRLAQIRDDARMGIVVTDGQSGPIAADAVVDLIADAERIAARRETNPSPLATPGDLAYVIYTSGSTGKPKGVMVEHRNLDNAYRGWEQSYGLDAWAGRHLQIAGAAFDVFTGDWSRALCSGGALISCPREAILDPEVLLDLLVRERVDCAEFVPAGVEGLVDLLERTGGTLGFMKLIAVGSDLVHAGLHERLRRLAGPGTRVVNSYGLTETTIDTTFFEGDLSALPPGRPAPIGGPFPGSSVYVLDDRLEPLAAGVTGELYIGGAGVTRGYLDRPAMTAERFLPDPFGAIPGARIYRTGDLARWRPDGSLDILGRADSQVKIRGYRIELGEVESALLRDPAVKAAAVVVREDRPGERRLMAFVVPADPEDPPAGADLRRRLKQGLPEYMVPASFGILDALPLTSNRKVDRRALAAIEPETQVAADSGPIAGVAPRTPAEATLARIAAEVMGVGGIGVTDNLFELGIDSVLIIQLVSRARAAGLRLDPALLFRHPTIADLAAATLDEKPAPAHAPAEPLLDDLPAVLAEFGPDAEDAYPLSPVQAGMIFQDRMAPDAGSYVEQFTCRLRGSLDVEAFARAWQAVIARHPALRTSFHRADHDVPVQVVRREAAVPIARLDWSGLDPAEQDVRLAALLRDDRRLGFAPAHAPLLRLALARLGDDLHALAWSGHHLIFDGWCLPIVLGEVVAAYEMIARGLEPALPPAPPFRDYIAWLRRQDLAEAEAFWRKALAGFRTPTPWGIEADRPDVPAGTPYAERERSLGPEATARLVAVARSARLTVATVIHGAWSLLLSRYAGRADVVSGVTVTGRPADLAGVERMVGVMVNTLPLRVAVDEEAEILPWLAGVQATLADLRRFEHTPLVRARQWSELPAGTPLFESILVVQNTPSEAELADRAGRLGVEAARVHEQSSYPLTVSVEPGERLRVWAGFDPRRHDGAAVDALLGHFLALIEGIASGTGRRLADLALLSRDEQQRLAREWDGDPGPTPGPDALADDDLDAAIAALRREIEEGNPS
ncbi:amino acid adenylation domain-containing protein [Tundrisphaera sp. TA3]|uniref:amino acid adenylation domain-containing protein n=1 Tax=Tundrisphaera sp. TA3 TaxID=3435775 RepID=UPI003EB9599C